MTLDFCKFKRTVTYHFKWFGNIMTKEREKIEARIKNGYFFFTEGQKLLEHIGKHGGRLF